MWAGLLAWLADRELPIGAALAIVVAWLVAEYTARRSTWAQGAPRRPSSALDHGTYPVIAIGLTSSLAFDLLAFVAGWTVPASVILVVIGGSVSAIGLAIRGWALRTLGRFFTMPITIAEDHRIIRDGPYRRLRHPSYTGGFLTALGLPIAMGSLAAVVFTLVACGAAYVYRIHLEEAALVRRFGDSYREYAAGTHRLFPGIY